MSNAPVYVLWVVIRMLWRVFCTCGVVSTRITAFPLLLISIRFADCYQRENNYQQESERRWRGQTHRSVLVNIGYYAVRRIAAGEEVPALEERAALLI